MYQLNPYLKKHWMTKARNKVLKGGRSSSKCLAVGTKVLMFDGTTKNVEDIVIGDKVMGPDSTVRNVLHTTRGIDEMYLVKQPYAMDYAVNSSHILSLQKRKAEVELNKCPKEVIWCGRKRITSGYRPDLPEYVNMQVTEFMNQTSKFKTIFCGYKVGQSYQEKSVSLDPYFLGLWLGDGDSCRPLITTADPETREFVKGFVEKSGSMLNEWRVNGAWHMNIVSGTDGKRAGANVIYNKLFELGQIRLEKDESRKSGKKYVGYKHIPQEYISNSREVRLQLLAGLLDSDGTYSQERGCYVYTSSSYPELAFGVKRLADSLGLRTTTGTKRTSFVYKGERKVGKICYSVNISGPKIEEIPCKIERKKAKITNGYRNNDDNLRSVLTIEPIGIGEYAGFSVDKDHLFCLEDGTVTHNSHDAAGMAVYLTAHYKIKFMCVRRFQNRITDSVYTLLKSKIEDSPFIKDFDILNNTIRHKKTGSEFLFYGLERNIEEIKSTEGVQVLWIEEAHSLTQEQWKILNPTVRAEDSEIWLIFNPNLITDFIWQHFIVNTPDDTIITTINFTDNPFMTETMRKVIENDRKKMGDEEFRHVYLGEPKATDDRAFIPLKFLLACKDAHIKLGWPDQESKAAQVGFDVADDGEDKNALSIMTGSVLQYVQSWKGLEDQLLASCASVYRHAVEHEAAIVFDCIGVGAAAGSKFNEMTEERRKRGISTNVTWHAFNAGGKVPRPDEVFLELPHKDILRGEHLENAKAAAWSDFAERVRNTWEAVEKGISHPIDKMISFNSECPEMDQLIMELSLPLKAESLSGKLMVERKKDMKKRGIMSPNRADSAIMAALQPETGSVNVMDAETEEESDDDWY